MKSKDMLFFGLFIGCVALMLWIIYLDEPKKEHVILSAHTDYIYHFEDERDMKFIFYVNDADSPLLTMDFYERVIVRSDTDDMHFEVTLNEVRKNHQESYLNQVYTQVVLYITIPYLESEVAIKNVLIDITLTRGQTITIPLGSLYIGYHHRSHDLELSWVSLYGFKSEQHLIPRIATVHVLYDVRPKQIKRIDVGLIEHITFEMTDDALIIHLPYRSALLYDFPLIISYEDGDIDVIPNFLYMKNYQYLVESGPLIYVTPLS